MIEMIIHEKSITKNSGDPDRYFRFIKVPKFPLFLVRPMYLVNRHLDAKDRPSLAGLFFNQVAAISWNLGRLPISPDDAVHPLCRGIRRPLS